MAAGGDPAGEYMEHLAQLAEKIRKEATIVVHNLKESKEICRKAIDKYGETAQIYLAMVEARYLAQALQRYLDCRREGAGRTSWKRRLSSCAQSGRR